MIGDLPEADAAPPENMLFVCKLNPVTTDEDLEIIFSRFGTLTSCDVIKDWKTGDSLNYAFIGFDTREACEQAYFKMNNVLIDDRRIKVDFSQSVHHLWAQFKKFGRKGDVGLRQEADTHQNGGGGGGGRNMGGLQLKDSGRGGGRYDLVFDGEEEEQRGDVYKHRNSDKNRSRSGGGDDRDRSDGRRGGVERRERSRDRKEESRDRRRHHRSRSRSREQQRRKSRQRSRSRSRDRNRYSHHHHRR